MKNNKINSLEIFVGELQAFRSNAQTIVFTNGCFDILHPGHIDYLTKAKNMGDILIVGLNTDDSIKRLKGSDRPINDLDFRAALLSGLESVDFIIPFSDDTPINLIREIKPDILAKGEDYTIDQVAGSKDVLEYGGHVELIPLLQGFSTTDIINKIKNL